MSRALAFLNPRTTTENVGDIFIEDSVKRILVYDAGRSIDVDPRRPWTGSEVDKINRCDAAVIVGSSLWYRDLRRDGRWTPRLEDLRRIRVPVIPFGVGTSRRFDEDDGFTVETAEQLRWIHGSCALGSARDPRTAHALAAAGIANVAMTGCPTMFRSLAPRWSLRWTDARRVALTSRAGQQRNARELLRQLRSLGLEPVLAAQKARDRLRRSLWRPREPEPETIFGHDIAPYLQLVETARGAAGWRLHGNMLHLAHGRPAVFFANNSRVQSFCEAFGLPCLAAADGQRIPPQRIGEHVRGLLDPATFARVPQAYDRLRAEMIRFLDANGLEHRLRAGPDD